MKDMNEMKEFYNKYGLSAYEFCTMLGANDRTLAKWLNGGPVKEATAKKFEAGIRLVEEHNLVRPKKKDYPSFAAHNIAVRKYRDDFKEMLEVVMYGE